MTQSNEVIFARPQSFRDVVTHYCPGCTHGIIHRLIAEVLDEFQLRERTVGVAPVGCSVLIYNYFNTDFLESPHGRAPALATGLKRVRPDLIVFTYQGDGDLASIGMGEIIHAANRGEKFTTIFVNNAIYGMTGGQMAPTTMPGQVTSTSPFGRKVEECGYPIRMAELLSNLRTPAYIERVAVHTPQNVIRAKKAIKKAFSYQMAAKCFTFVEVLSTCPTNWGLTPDEATDWLQKNMQPYYPLGCFKLPEDEEKNLMAQYEVTFAGFGGQGIMVAGQLLAYAGIKEGKNVVWLPSYGPEMRGGTAYCTVVISDSRIGSPIINNPRGLCVFNRPSLDKFGSRVKANGLLIINSSLIDAVSGRNDITELLVPANDIAIKAGSVRSANMAMLGTFVGASGVVGYETLRAIILEKMGRKKDLLEINYQVIEEGYHLGLATREQRTLK